MDKQTESPWQKILNPKTLKNNMINASIYSIGFEILKNSIKDHILNFYSNGFDENGFIVSENYKYEVLALHKSPIFASLEWLKKEGAIDDSDIELFVRFNRVVYIFWLK